MYFTSTVSVFSYLQIPFEITYHHLTEDNPKVYFIKSHKQSPIFHKIVGSNNVLTLLKKMILHIYNSKV